MLDVDQNYGTPETPKPFPTFKECVAQGVQNVIFNSNEFAEERYIDDKLMALNISSDLVPQVINDYNAYTEDDLLIGLADEVTLPKIKNKTTSVSGMGIAGEVDSPVPGQFESMEATLNWNTMYSFATKMMNPNKNIQITLRAAMQNDNKNGGYTYKGLRVVLGGRPKELDPGKLKRADTMGSTTTLEVTRYLMEVDGTTVIDIDKFAGRYYVDGEDMRAEINALI